MTSKQITLSIPLEEWKVLRIQAAHKGVSIAAMLKEWIAPHLEALCREFNAEAED